MRDDLGEPVERAGLRRPEVARDELVLLLEGALVTAEVEGSPRAAKTAKRIARRMIAEMTRE